MTEVLLNRSNLPMAVESLCDADQLFSEIYGQIGLPPLWFRKPGYASLAKIILEQQVSLASARATYKKLSQSLGRVTPYSVSRAGDQKLRACGLTRQKSRYFLILAEEVLTNRLDLNALSDMSGKDVESELTRVIGIGKWTSDIYRLMVLGHADVWPRGDIALYNTMRHFLGKGMDSASLDLHAQRWQPWRAAAARMLWFYYLKRLRNVKRRRSSDV